MKQFDSIFKLITGNVEKAQREELFSNIKRNPDELDAYKKIKTAWALTSPEKQISDYTIEESFDHLQKRIHLKGKSLKLAVFYKYAAAIFFLLFIGTSVLYMNSSSSSKQLVYTTVHAELGQMSNVVLPDHSTVWLNSGSSLKYSSQFGQDNRSIELHGEAFFEVTKDKDLPFIVTGGKVNVKVLGTKFNVSDYSDENTFTVALQEGSVHLMDAETQKVLAELVPGQVATHNKGANSIQIKNANIDLYTSWKKGVLNFYNSSIEEIVTKLSKRYNQQFEIDDELKLRHYTLEVKNESLEDVLRMMETISPMMVVQNGDIIKLKYKRK